MSRYEKQRFAKCLTIGCSLLPTFGKVMYDTLNIGRFNVIAQKKSKCPLKLCPFLSSHHRSFAEFTVKLCYTHISTNTTN
nr:MAG TPA: hypothetical protein [Caudoviricetes sp.]